LLRYLIRKWDSLERMTERTPGSVSRPLIVSNQQERLRYARLKFKAVDQSDEEEDNGPNRRGRSSSTWVLENQNQDFLINKNKQIKNMKYQGPRYLISQSACPEFSSDTTSASKFVVIAQRIPDARTKFMKATMILVFIRESLRTGHKFQLMQFYFKSI
jgi:hypothetical protein